jgi:type VI secretion system secreted protein Hcp
MASDIFAKIGDIKGESLDDKHKDEIEVLSFSWGVANAANIGGGGGGAGRATFHDLSFHHGIDKASPMLLKACATGEHLKEATITQRKAGKGQQEFLIIKMNDIIITGVSLGDTSDGGQTPLPRRPRTGRKATGHEPDCFSSYQPTGRLVRIRPDGAEDCRTAHEAARIGAVRSTRLSPEAVSVAIPRRKPAKPARGPSPCARKSPDHLGAALRHLLAHQRAKRKPSRREQASRSKPDQAD